jgi:hypothetical protein
MWSPGSAVAIVEADDRVILLDLASIDALPVVLAGTALSIWRAVVRGGDRIAVIEEVASSYGVSPHDVAHDVERFASELVAAGLLRLEGG